jgi:hypothetical protein
LGEEDARKLTGAGFAFSLLLRFMLGVYAFCKASQLAFHVVYSAIVIFDLSSFNPFSYTNIIKIS